ncbi:MAG: multifunctional oxoglutarate decarboxylase/oxoglutarate dehydrogenase thiamine pyrophosphate-binding subunit/dihydrolipoyllysine-residue succinyltransferase subunit [Rhodothermales bacterium]|nr:multifunctional oxoglutarate decarboxylase/oxoglutarate dehydrogenase thiamine pyrophosphate-binding subunit/dihydrolipoyllysine-residue succinyltransferase subunit [Rhodothermales bacterium]MBO6778490.1 multifunctional oxoglutarate decarboxylase/oxoglutarate dehydrogenase thiamine pyrophosphate-binding subunit/dihydrolipoyllysine-residue succinyltransferase subunit [Rhodothermales bacterium]
MSNLGFNTGYIEDLYRQYLEDPNSVSESWRDFFQDYNPGEEFVAATPAQPATAPAQTPTATATQAPTGRGDGATAAADLQEGAEAKAIRGPAAKIVENMEASLQVPTATSVRSVPVKLLAENRQLINAHQRDVGGNKVSYTHLIAYAIVKGIAAFPNMNTTFRQQNGTPEHVIPGSVNLGLAIDVERRGRRSLLVPNIKGADGLSFREFLGHYNDLVRRARDNKLEIADFMGTTASITNPGMIGTALSVPRLMQGQGLIVGVGSIGYPTEYHAFPPEVIARTGISQVMSITSTYDHRVIQGAESGAFLKHVEELLTGHHSYYEEIFQSLGIPYQPYVGAVDSTPMVGGQRADELDMVRKQAKVLQLIRAYRVRGHLQADVNPLGYNWRYHPELDPKEYGLTIWDLDREFVTGGLAGHDMLPLRDILEILRQTYTRKVGVEFMHISDPQEKRWLVERIEPVRGVEPISETAKKRMLEKLNGAEAFENFLHTKYIGHKRFSLEGSETVIPMLDMILSDAANQETAEVVIGMAHRGRLNVLANILNKPYEVIFSEFEGNIDPNTTQGSGDVKYHLGARDEHESPSGSKVKVTLASNPSHLEAVNPVVEGMARAKQEAIRDERGDSERRDYHDAVLPILIHGDAAFAGQGVVGETLHLSQLPGYETGGTVHIVINNQIGFTTGPESARSSTYASDIARMIQAPIFHVNGDDPEACVRVARLALDFRQVFNKDVVIDLLCYRVRGHNEGDEPTYTQPLLYKKIEAKRSVRKLYTELLLRRGDMSPEEAEQVLEDYRNRLNDAFTRTKEVTAEEPAPPPRAPLRSNEPEGPVKIETAASQDLIDAVIKSLMTFPEGFNVHKKLLRQFQRREKLYHDERKVDWGFAEALAFGTILAEGRHVRLSGQDSRRGTFSHRHGVVYDQENADEYIPLNHVAEKQGRLYIYDSLLSEYAVTGFEYGYSVASPDSLVIWEAQFGDFANGAQIIFDQFLSAAGEKWGQESSLVLLLPHGYEGQGPEHSSARLERFLQLCAEGNMQVCNITTPANIFHALRRQVHSEKKLPLVVMSPKSLLRHPLAVSDPADFTESAFRPVIPADVDDPSSVERLVFCSGKVYYDALQKLKETGAPVALARVEELYPLDRAAIREELSRFPSAKVIWLQEEPANMGAWQFIRYPLEELLAEVRGDDCERIGYAGRPMSASPATGSHHVHAVEQDGIVARALGLESE